MGYSIRQYLLEELGVKESKNLSNISKFVRANTKLRDEDKCECCVCRARSKQLFPHEQNTKIIYNHHVMKVEYLGILADRFHLVRPINPDLNVNKLNSCDYTFVEGFKMYSPRVAICNEHHTMFHELVGDNEIKYILNVTVEEAENIVDVFEKFNDDIKVNCTPNENDSSDLLEYKNRYQGIWDETLIKSLMRLSYMVEINELKYELTEEEQEKFEDIKLRIETIINETLEYDDSEEIRVPEVDVFTLKELKIIEDELTKTMIIKQDNIIAIDTERKDKDSELDLSDLSPEDLEEIINILNDMDKDKEDEFDA